jgi:hypothetical protein
MEMFSNSGDELQTIPDVASLEEDGPLPSLAKMRSIVPSESELKVHSSKYIAILLTMRVDVTQTKSSSSTTGMKVDTENNTSLVTPTPNRPPSKQGKINRFSLSRGGINSMELEPLRGFGASEIASQNNNNEEIEHNDSIDFGVAPSKAESRKIDQQSS